MEPTFLKKSFLELSEHKVICEVRLGEKKSKKTSIVQLIVRSLFFNFQFTERRPAKHGAYYQFCFRTFNFRVTLCCSEHLFLRPPPPLQYCLYVNSEFLLSQLHILFLNIFLHIGPSSKFHVPFQHPQFELKQIYQ